MKYKTEEEHQKLKQYYRDYYKKNAIKITAKRREEYWRKIYEENERRGNRIFN